MLFIRVVAVISLLSLLVMPPEVLGGQQQKPSGKPAGKPAKAQEPPKGDLKLGESVFKEICFSCHGERGDGKGPSWLNTKPAPQVFANPEYMARLTDQYMFDVVKYGKLAVLKEEGTKPAYDVMPMPSFEQVLEDDQIRRLIAFERAFHNGRPQDPEIREIFLDACARCHGERGGGDGPDAKPAGVKGSRFVSLIQPAPADYTNPLFMDRFEDDFLFWLIKKGRIGATEEKEYDTMRPYGHVLSDEEIWSVVRYLRETFINQDQKKR
jgi:mono/diheme cytochrome c family protein